MTKSGYDDFNGDFTISVATKTVDFTLVVPELGHDVEGNMHTFSQLYEGDAEGTQDDLTVVVTGENNNVTAALTAGDTGDFELTDASMGTIADGATDTFTVAAADGLTSGTYTATVTISSGTKQMT